MSRGSPGLPAGTSHPGWGRWRNEDWRVPGPRL